MTANHLSKIELPEVHHSFIIRCWRVAHAELRGQIINPITHQVHAFSSIANLHELLDRIVADIHTTEQDDR